MILNLEEFKELLCLTLDDPIGMAGFESNRIKPFTDAIGALSKWYGFSEKAVRERERGAVNPPYVNPFRPIGRNDPCPCGSGKKYKKCCLQ